MTVSPACRVATYRRGRVAPYPSLFATMLIPVRAKLGAFLILVISGCASTLPSPDKVYIRVNVPCLEKSSLPVFPTILPNAELAKLSDFDLVIRLQTERLELLQYGREVGAILPSCVK